MVNGQWGRLAGPVMDPSWTGPDESVTGPATGTPESAKSGKSSELTLKAAKNS